MLQNHLTTKIKFQQTMLKLCLITRCLQDQLVLGHMGNDAGATKWLNTFGCKKSKISTHPIKLVRKIDSWFFCLNDVIGTHLNDVHVQIF
jgi:hypothetical protein